MSRSLFTFDEAAFKHPFAERSEFKVVFSRIRMAYIQSIEGFIRKACEAKKIAFTVDYDSMTMEVATTGRTRDPYIFVKAGDMIQLLSKGVPLEDAARALEDEVFCEIVSVNLLCSNEKTFERRRNRISNPKTLKAIELLTKCSIYISGKVACIIGGYRGLNDAKNIVVSCFENVHPVFEIKKLIVKKKLEKDGVEGDWDRFVPKIKKTHSKHKVVRRPRGEMPAEIQPRKEDLQRETGEYYLDEENLKRDLARENARRRQDLRRKAKLEKHVVPDE